MRIAGDLRYGFDTICIKKDVLVDVVQHATTYIMLPNGMDVDGLSTVATGGRK
jgi:hypothetical protein